MKTVRVYPSPKLNAEAGEYLPGIGAAGAELPEDEANDLVERGLAVKTKPKTETATPAAPAETEAQP